MSNVYQGIVLAGDGSVVAQFLNDHPSRMSVRLAELAPGLLGVYRSEFASGRLIDWDEAERQARQLSAEFGPALAVFRDNRFGVDLATLFAGGLPVREFGEADEVWVAYNAIGDGTLDLDGPRYAGDQIPSDVECDCIRGAIDAGLEAAGWGVLQRDNLIDAFAHNASGWLAEWPARPA